MTITRRTYQSLAEFADVANVEYLGRQATFTKNRDEWAGATCEEAFGLASNGWADGLTKATEIVNNALALVEREHPAQTFESYHDVVGGQVDVGRYLAGMPECMVEYEMPPISRVGRVVTLVASVSYSGAISSESAFKRGAAITALALALEATGHETELWADLSSESRNGHFSYVRVLVKGAHDLVDPERIAFAYGHPAMLRRLGFMESFAMPANMHLSFGLGKGYGLPTDCEHDLPDGTIYLPSLRSSSDVPDADRFVTDHLRSLGLLSD